MSRLLIALGAFAMGCTLIGCSLCSDHVLSQRRSPDGVLVATLYERDCGATTDFNTILSVSLPPDFKDRNAIMFAAKGQKEVSFKWVGKRSLYVECSSCVPSAVLKQVTVAGGVDVTYVLPFAKSSTVGR
jgi:hypothetical protein